MLSKILAIMEMLENEIGEHSIRFYLNGTDLVFHVVQMKTQKAYMRVFSKHEISDINDESILINMFIEEVVHSINET